MTFEERVEELLRAKHLRWADLARMVDKGQSNLQISVRGNPRLQLLEDIAKALNVPVTELLPESGTSFTDGVLRVGNRTYALKPIEILSAPYYEYKDTGSLGFRLKGFLHKCWQEPNEFHSLCGVYVEEFPFAIIYEPKKNCLLITMNKSDVEDVAWVYQLDEIYEGEDADAITESVVADVLGDIKYALAEENKPEGSTDQ